MTVQFAKDAEKLALEAASEDERQRTLYYILGEIEYAARRGWRRTCFSKYPFINDINGSVKALEWCFECLRFRGFDVKPVYKESGGLSDVTITW